MSKPKCGIGFFGITRAKCLCGHPIEIALEEAKGKSKEQLNDLLLDRYNAHVVERRDLEAGK